MPKLVHVVPPVGYFDSLGLVRNARVVATDSGGMQKEAFMLQTPCVTLRDTSEWVETLEHGWNVLVDADTEKLTAALAAASPGRPCAGCYGAGDAGERIAAVVVDLVTGGPQ
jgi:UDP-N-acetylglucosamine 2-epimerase